MTTGAAKGGQGKGGDGYYVGGRERGVQRTGMAVLPLVVLAALILPRAVAQSADGGGIYREVAATKDLMSDSAYANRVGLGQHGGRGALTCHEFGRRVMMPHARVSVAAGGRTVLTTNTTTTVDSLVRGDVAQVAVYENTLFSCIQVTIGAGIVFPPAGSLTVAGTFGPAQGMEESGFVNNERFVVNGSFDIAERSGPQNVIVSMGSPLEAAAHSYIAYHAEDDPAYVTSEPAAKLALAPLPNATAAGELEQGALLFKVELIVPSAALTTPVLPQVKAVTSSSLRVYLPRQAGQGAVDVWRVSFAGPGTKFFSSPVLAKPGSDMPIDGLVPSSVYQISCCAVLLANNVTADASGPLGLIDKAPQQQQQQASKPLDPTERCFQVQGTTKPHLGLAYKAVGPPAAFPRDESEGGGVVLLLPARRCDNDDDINCDKWASATVSLTLPADGSTLFSRTYTKAGLFEESGFSTDDGYDMRVVYKTASGNAETDFDGFRPRPAFPRAGGLASGEGEPRLMRVSPTSLVMRLYETLPGSTVAIAGAAVAVRDASTEDPLFVGNFSGRGHDVKMDNIHFRGAWAVEVTVLLVDKHPNGGGEGEGDGSDTSSTFYYAFPAVGAAPASREVGLPIVELLAGGRRAQVEVPPRINSDSAVVMLSQVRAQPLLAASNAPKPTSEASNAGGGKLLLLDLPKADAFTVDVDTRDSAGLSNTHRTLVVSPAGTMAAAAAVPVAGTPTVLLTGDAAARVTVPSQVFSNDAGPVEGVDIVVIDSMSGKTVDSASTEAAGSFDVKLPTSPDVPVSVAVTVTSPVFKKKKRPNSPAVVERQSRTFTTLMRPSGLPSYNVRGDAAVYFQDSFDGRQRIVVRVPKQMPSTTGFSDGPGLVLVRIIDQLTGKSVEARTVEAGPDAVFEGYNATNRLRVEVTPNAGREGSEAQHFERPLPGSKLAYEREDVFGTVRVVHSLVQTRVGDTKPRGLPDRSTFDGVVLFPARDAVVVRVAQYTKDRKRIMSAKVHVRRAAPPLLGSCLGETTATYEIGSETDAFVPLPAYTDVDVCVLLDTSVQGDIAANFHVLADSAGGVAPMAKASTAVELFPSSDGRALTVRVPLRAVMRGPDAPAITAAEADVSGCRVTVADAATGAIFGEKGGEYFGEPGDFTLEGLDATAQRGTYLVSAKLLGGGGAFPEADVSMSVLVVGGDASDGITAEPSVVPKIGLPSALYDHEASTVKIVAPKAVSSAARAITVQYTVRSAASGPSSGGTVVAKGSAKPGTAATRVALGKADESNDTGGSFSVDFVVLDSKGETHQYTTTTRRVGRLGLPPMPQAGPPRLVATSQHRLLLRIPSRADPAYRPVLSAKSAVRFCDDHPDDGWRWEGTSAGGGDIELPAALVAGDACYVGETNVTETDGGIRKFAFDFDFATAGLPPMPTTCLPTAIPRGTGGVIVIKACAFTPNEDLAAYDDSRVFANVTSAAQGEPLVLKQVLRSKYTAVPTPCRGQDCMLNVDYRMASTGDGRTLRRFFIQAANSVAYRRPNDPDAWVPAWNTVIVRNPLTGQRVSVNVTDRATNESVANGTFTSAGEFPLRGGLAPRRRYKIALQWELHGDVYTADSFVTTPLVPGGSDVQPPLRVLASPFAITVQLPATTRDLPIRKALLLLTKRSCGVEGSVAADARERIVAVLGEAGVAEHFNASEVEILAMDERDVPAAGEQVVFNDLKSETLYNITTVLVGTKGGVEILRNEVKTNSVSYILGATHRVASKNMAPPPATDTAIQIATYSPLPTSAYLMMLGHHSVDTKQKATSRLLVDFYNRPNTQPPPITRLAAGTRFVLKLALLKHDEKGSGGRGESDDRCAYVTTDLPWSATSTGKGRDTPQVVRVTTSEVVIYLPTTPKVRTYQISRVFRNDAGMETSRAFMYEGLGEFNQHRGFVFYARALPADSAAYFDVVPVLKSGKTAASVALAAHTDSDFLPCAIGRPTQPFPPTVVAGSLQPGARRFTVMWAPVETNEGPDPTAFPVESYDVEVRCRGYNGSRPNATFQLMRTAVHPDQRSYTQAGIVPGFAYDVRVIALNIFGTSPPGRIGSLIVPSEVPKRPKRPSAAALTRSAVVSWKLPYHNGEPLAGVVVECNPPPSLSATVYPSATRVPPLADKWGVAYDGPPVSSITVVDLMPAAKYRCRVSARNAVGLSNASEPVAFDTYTDVPEKIIQMHSNETGRYHVELEWSKPRHNGLPILGYNMEMATLTAAGDAEFSPVPECRDMIGSSTCRIGRLLPGRQYAFRVDAGNCAGRSDFSDALILRAESAPPSPAQALRLLGSSETTLDIAWATGETNGAPITHHEVMCDGGLTCLSGGWSYPQEPPCVHFGDNLVEDAPLNASADALAAMYGSIWKETSDRVDASSPTATLIDLRPATTYRCRVYLHNSAGRSNASEYFAIRTRDTVPSAVDNLRLDRETYDSDTNSVRLLFKWDKAANNGQNIVSTEIQRKVVRRTESSSGFAVVNPSNPADVGTWAPVLSCPDPDVSPMAECTAYLYDDARIDASFYVRVRAVNAAGPGPWTTIHHTTPVGKPAAPLIPQLVTKTATSITVTCVPVDDNGSPINYYALKKSQGVVSGSSDTDTEEQERSQFVEWETAFEWNMPAGGSPSLSDEARQNIVLDDLEQGTDYALVCLTGNNISQSAESPMGVFATFAAPPDTPPPPALVSKDESSISVMLEYPDDNGKRLSKCTIWVGGAWEYCGNLAGHSCSGTGLAVPNFDPVAGGAMGPPRDFVTQTIPGSALTWTEGVGYDEMRFVAGSDIEMADPPCVECHEESSTGGFYSYKALLPGTTYCFRLRCANEVGSGAFSDYACFDTAAKPPRAPDTGVQSLSSRTTVSATVHLPEPFGYGAEIQSYKVVIKCQQGTCDGMSQSDPNYCTIGNVDAATLTCHDPVDESSGVLVSACSRGNCDTTDCESCDLTGLNAGTTYAVIYYGETVDGVPSPWSSPFSFDTAADHPLPVRSVTAVATAAGGITVSWDAPLFDQGSPVHSYEIYVACDPSATQPASAPTTPSCSDIGTLTVTAGAAARQKDVVTGLVPGKFYRVGVAAINSEGASDIDYTHVNTDSSTTLQTSSVPAIGLADAPSLASTGSEGVTLDLPAPAEKYGALYVQEYHLQCAEAGTTAWIGPNDASTDSYLTLTLTVDYQPGDAVSVLLKVDADNDPNADKGFPGLTSTSLGGPTYWCRYRVVTSGGACNIVGSPCSTPSAWSGLTPALDFLSACPVGTNGQVCSAHGSCSLSSNQGSCVCQIGWAGLYCDKAVSTAQSCMVMGETGEVTLWGETATSYTHDDVGEFVLYANEDVRPSEIVTVVHAAVQGHIRTKLVGVAMQYRGQTVTIQTTGENCETMRHNCRAEVDPSQSDLVVYEDTINDASSSRGKVTATRQCPGGTADVNVDVQIENTDTGTVVVCTRDDSRQWFESCHITTTRVLNAQTGQVDQTSYDGEDGLCGDDGREYKATVIAALPSTTTSTIDPVSAADSLFNDFVAESTTTCANYHADVSGSSTTSGSTNSATSTTATSCSSNQFLSEKTNACVDKPRSDITTCENEKANGACADGHSPDAWVVEHCVVTCTSTSLLELSSAWSLSPPLPGSGAERAVKLTRAVSLSARSALPQPGVIDATLRPDHGSRVHQSAVARKRQVLVAASSSSHSVAPVPSSLVPQTAMKLLGKPNDANGIEAWQHQQRQQRRRQQQTQAALATHHGQAPASHGSNDQTGATISTASAQQLPRAARGNHQGRASGNDEGAGSAENRPFLKGVPFAVHSPQQEVQGAWEAQRRLLVAAGRWHGSSQSRSSSGEARKRGVLASGRGQTTFVSTESSSRTVHPRGMAKRGDARALSLALAQSRTWVATMAGARSKADVDGEISTTGNSSTLDEVVPVCPPDVDEETCQLAQVTCSNITHCKTSCVQNFFESGGDKAATMNKAERCERRMESVMAEEASKNSVPVSIPEESVDPATSVLLCPTVVFGDELWNMAPWDSQVLSWDSAVVHEVVGEILEAASNVTNTTNGTNFSASVGTSLSLDVGGETNVASARARMRSTTLAAAGAVSRLEG